MTPATLVALANGDIANAIVSATPGGIEKQEKDGQIAESFNTNLPIELDRAKFEAAGFIFGEKVDDLFMSTTWPAGWCKRITDHDMYTDIVDSEGVKRGSIFYKAAWYDRSAFARLD